MSKAYRDIQATVVESETKVLKRLKRKSKVKLLLLGHLRRKKEPELYSKLLEYVTRNILRGSQDIDSERYEKII